LLKNSLRAGFPKSRALSRTPLNTSIAALRCVFDALHRPRVMSGIRYAPNRRAAHDALSVADVQRLLAATNNIKHGVMFALLYGDRNTNLRVTHADKQGHRLSAHLIQIRENGNALTVCVFDDLETR
jgi:hypothetical protein